MKKLPKFLKQYFWDMDFEKMDAQKSRVSLLRRILNYGDEKALQWLNEHFSKKEQADALCVYRDFSLKSANFWAVVLGIDKRKVKCLQKPYLEIRKQFWPY